MANVQSIVFINNSFKVTLTAPADSSYHTGTGQVLDYTFPYTATYPFNPVFSNEVSIDPVGADGSTVDTGKIFIPTGTTTFTFYVDLNFNDPYGPEITVNGTIDSTEFSKVFSVPASATLQTSNAGAGDTESVAIAYDYSSHFSRMITAQEQTANATTESVNKLNQINSTLENKLNQINSTLETLNSKIEDLNSKIETIKTLAEGDGLHIVGPWEWLGQVGIVQYLEEKELDLAELKAKVDAIPKTFTPPGGGS